MKNFCSKTILHLLFLIIGCFVLASLCQSCTLSQSKKEKIDELVKENLDYFAKKENEAYRKRILDSASTIVDSLLIIRALESRASDTLYRPAIPSKPSTPIVKSDSLDSIEIKPLF